MAEFIHQIEGIYEDIKFAIMQCLFEVKEDDIVLSNQFYTEHRFQISGFQGLKKSSRVIFGVYF